MNILRTLDQLLEDTMLEADTFEALANPSDVRTLSGAMPDVLDGVAKAVQQASEVARHLLPSSIVGGEDNARMAARMEQIDQVCVCVHAQFTA
jgi:hypothetical protein